MNADSDNEDSYQITVRGDGYTYIFSRGLLAHALTSHGIELSNAYRVTKYVYRQLKKEGIYEISETDLQKYIKQMALKYEKPEVVEFYELVDRWKALKIPLIILLSAARGIGSEEIANEVGKVFSITNLITTSMVAHILRRTITNDFAPELHSKSYKAFEKLRPMYSALYDNILIGFEEHARFPAEGVEALVHRAIREGQSIIIRGEHLVPRFLSTDLTKHPSVIYITLRIKDPEVHKNRYISRYHEDEIELRNHTFFAIRKIHDYLVQEAIARKYTVVDATNKLDVIQEINKIVRKRLEKLLPEYPLI